MAEIKLTKKQAKAIHDHIVQAAKKGEDAEVEVAKWRILFLFTWHKRDDDHATKPQFDSIESMADKCISNIRSGSAALRQLFLVPCACVWDGDKVLYGSAYGEHDDAPSLLRKPSP